MDSQHEKMSWPEKRAAARALRRAGMRSHHRKMTFQPPRLEGDVARRFAGMPLPEKAAFIADLCTRAGNREEGEERRAEAVCMLGALFVPWGLTNDERVAVLQDLVLIAEDIRFPWTQAAALYVLAGGCRVP